jgi:cell wall-associated NlpC family hydrolase
VSLTRTAGAVLALVLVVIGATDAASRAAGRSDAPGAMATVAASTLVSDSPTPAPTVSPPAPAEQPVWVAASVATVWIKPAKARPIDRPALRAHPRIARWISRQTIRQRLALLSRVMTQALQGEPALRLTRRSGWSKVRVPDQRGSAFPDGIIGWIPTRQLTTTQPRHHALPLGVRPHGTGRSVLTAARSYLGVRYLYAGLSRSGIDCSGLTYRVFRQHGVELPRDAADQARLGSAVKRSELRRGDLVFFGATRSSIHHVGIYAGHGLVLNAPHTGTVVQYTPLRAWSDYWGARRIL